MESAPHASVNRVLCQHGGWSPARIAGVSRPAAQSARPSRPVAASCTPAAPGHTHESLHSTHRSAFLCSHGSIIILRLAARAARLSI